MLAETQIYSRKPVSNRYEVVPAHCRQVRALSKVCKSKSFINLSRTSGDVSSRFARGLKGQASLPPSDLGWVTPILYTPTAIISTYKDSGMDKKIPRLYFASPIGQQRVCPEKGLSR